jgi:type I restriction enzyme M protein
MVYKIDKKDILSYKSVVMKTCDVLRISGMKASSYPDHMMPFFALLMIESRLIRAYESKKAEGLVEEDILEEIQEEEKGYNSIGLEKKLWLKDICQNDKSFEVDLMDYLHSYDEETQMLLGVRQIQEGEKFLDLLGMIQSLKAKKILFQFCQAWSEIDLTPYSNSDITTLEEHIKREWADMSAETAGEQYTPDDIIELIANIITERTVDRGSDIAKLYDMTCGGGNMLFGVEDEIEKRMNKDISIYTYGQEIQTPLYALAKIESRFRNNSFISCGNTLTEDKFVNEKMDYVVANPPYGVNWKGYEQEIRNDEQGRFDAGYPSVSDGQLLFVQHAIEKLSREGQALIVLNGSPLFSGDAGSGESEIRRWILENDLLEGLIQLPTSEFFNTSITTYLWIINKDKPLHRKNKIKLIDASKMFTKLKKSKGSKTSTISQYVPEITELLQGDVETDNCKIYDKDFFFFNKQQIELTDVDVNGLAFVPPMKNDKPQKVILAATEIKFDITELETEIQEFAQETDLKVKARNKTDLYADNIDKVIIKTIEGDYSFNTERQTIVKTFNDVETDLGCGVIKVKVSYKKATTKEKETLVTTVELLTKTEKDNEIIEYSSDIIKNEELKQSFLNKWVERQYIPLENKVGVEINFNKIFYKPEVLRPIDDIKTDLKASNAVLLGLMGEIFND